MYNIGVECRIYRASNTINMKQIPDLRGTYSTVKLCSTGTSELEVGALRVVLGTIHHLSTVESHQLLIDDVVTRGDGLLDCNVQYYFHISPFT